MSAHNGSDSRPLRRALLYVGAAAVTTRLLYMVEHAASPFFGFPVLDEVYYLTVARLLVAGGSLAEINPGFRPLLYPGLLAGLLWSSPEWGATIAVVLQHLLGVLTALGTALLAWRLTTSARVAGTAGLLYTLAGPPLFFEGELLNTALTAFIVVCLLHLLFALSLSDGPTSSPREPLLWLGAGLMLGLAAQLRPNALAVAAAFPLSALAMRGAGAARRVLLPAAALFGLVTALALFGWIQRDAFGAFQLQPGSGGVNFYLGNSGRADGMTPRQDYPVAYGNTYLDSVQIFARLEAHRARGVEMPEPTAAEVSAYWYRRSVEEILEAPWSWAKLLGRKALLLIWSYEIPSNRSFEFAAREESRLLRWLPVRWWLLAGLALLGTVAIAGKGDRSRLLWLVGFSVLWSLGIVLFFVTARYRIPLWPGLCALAGAGVVRLFELASQCRWPDLGLSVGLVGALSVASAVNWLEVPPASPGRDLLFRSQAHLEGGRLGPAEEDARRALELDPDDPVVRFQLGTLALERDRLEEALRFLRQALQHRPMEPRIWNNGGIALERLGRYQQAYSAYLRSKRLAPDYSPALINAALLELRGGLTERAADHLDAAKATGDDSVLALCGLAFVARARGEDEKAERLLAKARGRDAALVERLEAEQETPITLENP